MATQPAPWSALDLQKLGSFEILNSLADGAYVTNSERNILFWNQAAERITGWMAADVVGHSCQDNLLVHVDIDGHRLCGKEYCPLHRSIVTNAPSTEPLLVFAQRKDGSRVPVEVSVAPIRDREGEVVGGIEVFRDLTTGMEDLVRARLIQEQALRYPLLTDPRIEVAVRYTPNEIVGGDFYQIEALDADRYAIMVADVMGHGVASALYTMQLRSLWEDYRGQLASPAKFAGTINCRLSTLARDAGYFATAVCLTINVQTGAGVYVRAGHPAPLLLACDGEIMQLDDKQPALGMFADAEYRDVPFQLRPGDGLLLYTDGAIEVAGPDDVELGVDGLIQLVRQQGTTVDLASLEEQLLRFSDKIRLSDDLTLLRIRLVS